MASNHDQTKLGLDENVTAESSGTYHWPFIEVLQWVDERTGVHFMPNYRIFHAPPPSLARAAKLSGVQLGKFGFYMLFSLPVLLLLFGLLPKLKRMKGFFHRNELPFFAVWMLPAGFFFIIGHCGSLAYLQICLSGFSVLTVLLLSRAWGEGQTFQWQRWQVLHASLTALGLAFFLFARPYQSLDVTGKLLDVLALQYSGHGIRAGYSVARSNTNLPGPAVLSEWSRFETDAEIIHYFDAQPQFKTCLIKPHVVR
jgi:hypothetical protein